MKVLSKTARSLWSISLFIAVFCIDASHNLYARATVAELLAQIAPSGPVGARREVLSELRQVKSIDGTAATTVILGDTRWKQIGTDFVQRFQSDNPNESRPKPPTDAEIIAGLEKGHTRYYECSQLWFVDQTVYPEAEAGLKARFVTADHPSSYAREIGFVGSVEHWAIYAYTPIWSWIYMQERLKAVGGDDPLASAVRGLHSSDGTTASSCEWILANGGVKAVPHLRNLLQSIAPEDVIWLACGALAENKSAEAGEALAEFAKSRSPFIASSARRHLVFRRRPEGKALYFEWMEQDAGRTAVHELLEACAATDKQSLGQFLPRILARPHTEIEYRRAFELTRELSSRPILAALIDAEHALQAVRRSGPGSTDQDKVDQLVGVITSSPDVEAAAHIGLSLSLVVTKGPVPWGDAGSRILGALPLEVVRRVVTPLLAASDDEWFQSHLKRLLRDSH